MFGLFAFINQMSHFSYIHIITVFHSSWENVGFITSIHVLFWSSASGWCAVCECCKFGIPS